MARVISESVWQELQAYRSAGLTAEETRKIADGLQDLDAPLPMDLWGIQYQYN